MQALVALAASAITLQKFSPGAFIIRRQIGQLGFATETEWAYKRDGVPVTPNPLDGAQPKRTVEASGISVRLFDAKLDDGTRVLLKEFIGDARAIGSNEADVYDLLYGRAVAESRYSVPLGTLLGTMRADSTFGTDAFQAAWQYALPGTPPPSLDGLWLVFAWEGLSTVAGYPLAPQERPWFDLDGRGALKARRAYTKLACRRVLETVGWLHGQGVVHRSLGSSSLLLSSYDQTVNPQLLQVKAIDLGFATSASQLDPSEVAAAMARGATSPMDVVPFLARADDLHAVAYVLLELVIASAREAPRDAAAARDARAEARTLDVQALKRLVEDVFDGDVCGAFRNYVCEEPEWAPAAELLDESGRAGWELLQELVACREASSEQAEGVTCERLLASPWLETN